MDSHYWIPILQATVWTGYLGGLLLAAIIGAGLSVAGIVIVIWRVLCKVGTTGAALLRGLQKLKKPDQKAVSLAAFLAAGTFLTIVRGLGNQAVKAAKNPAGVPLRRRTK